MDSCEGLRDWLKCSKCEYLCTNLCPLEGENVIQELGWRLKTSEERNA